MANTVHPGLQKELEEGEWRLPRSMGGSNDAKIVPDAGIRQP